MKGGCLTVLASESMMVTATRYSASKKRTSRRINKAGGKTVIPWEKNAVSYINNGDAGACPVCGSREIRAEKHIFGDRLSVSLMCMKCKAASHFDGFLPEKEDGRIP